MSGGFVLQRMIPDDSRGLWFDAKTFDSKDRAEQELKFQRASQQLEINAWGGSGYTGRRVQQMRIVQVLA